MLCIYLLCSLPITLRHMAIRQTKLGDGGQVSEIYLLRHATALAYKDHISANEALHCYFDSYTGKPYPRFVGGWDLNQETIILLDFFNQVEEGLFFSMLMKVTSGGTSG